MGRPVGPTLRNWSDMAQPKKKGAKKKEPKPEAKQKEAKAEQPKAKAKEAPVEEAKKKNRWWSRKSSREK